MVNARKSDEKSKPALKNVGSGPMRTGRGRKDKVGRSAVDPFTRPDAPKDEDQGGSEPTCEGRQDLGGLGKDGSLAAHLVGDIVEIPPEDWIGFFDSFSRQHERWLASIEITLGKEKRTELRDRPLDGISCDHLSGRHEIYLSFEGGDGEHLTHPVPNPIKVVFRRDLAGAHEGVDINAADGSLTSVRFRIATKPETLDGLRSGTNLAPRSTNNLAGRRKPHAHSGRTPA